jgi:hypothetical protein
MQRSELVAELERLLAEAAAAREQLEGILGEVTALRSGLRPAVPGAPPPAPPSDETRPAQ